MAKLKINRGTDFDFTIQYKVNAVATTLVGATLFLTVKPVEYDSDLTDASATISKTKTTYAGTGDNAEAGIAVISLVPADTQGKDPIDYTYDIKVKNAAGKTYKLDEGIITLDGSPTNRLV